MGNPHQTKAATARYKVFAQNYVIDHNATRSAKAAGYSAKTAGVQGSKLLKIPRVQRFIVEFETRLANRTDHSQDRLLRELERMINANMDDFTRPDENGDLTIDMRNATRDQLTAVQEFSVDQTGGTGDGERKVVLRRKIKMTDRLKAIELMAKILGYIVDKKEVKKTPAESMTDEEINKRLAELLGQPLPETTNDTAQTQGQS